MAPRRIVFHTGGAYHHTDVQAAAIIDWLGASDHTYQMLDGAAAFEALDGCDLLVLMGMHWPGMDDEALGEPPYVPLAAHHRAAFEAYIAAGRPLLLHHAAIFSYDDWPRFRELTGFWWDWEHTGYVPVTEYKVTISEQAHPVTAGVGDYRVIDELYVDIQLAAGFNPRVLAAVHLPREDPIRANGHSHLRRVPVVYASEGGRVPGAGRLVYLVNGHDMRAFQARSLRQMWLNAVAWLLEA